MALSKKVDVYELTRQILLDRSLHNVVDLWVRHNGKPRDVQLVVNRLKQSSSILWSYNKQRRWDPLSRFDNYYMGNADEKVEDDFLAILFPNEG
jgi:hypothetical protein